ncbi:MAG: hypothetical protein U0263_17485 [Polyangiaceae bacterium]
MRPLVLARWLALGALVAFAPACDISPQPAPRADEIHSEAITLHVLGPSSVELRGHPGAVTATSPLWVWNAELADADGSVESASDGSFSVVMNGQLADVYRLDVTPGPAAPKQISPARATEARQFPSFQRSMTVWRRARCRSTSARWRSALPSCRRTC